MAKKSTCAAEPKAVRQALRAWPGVTEREHFSGPSFRAHGKMFALYWLKEALGILKLPRARQAMLFATGRETFQPMRSGRMIWSYVRLDGLEPGELADLLARAWRDVAPRTLAASLPPD